MGEQLVTALLNTLMGMGTVFIVLIFISLIISLFVYIPRLERSLKRLFSGRKGGKNKAADEPEQTKAAPKRPVLPKEVLEEELVDDGELAAVIMAAILASEGGAVSADKLRVRSIRRVNNKRR